MSEPEVRTRIRAQVLEQLGAVTERVVAAIQAEIPTYAALSRDQVAEVTDIASWGTLRILDLWVEDVGLTADDLRQSGVVEHPAQRLPDLICGVALGHRHRGADVL